MIMKELSIEEKAKAYDETLERAKQLLRTSLASDRRIIERILPELKENEDESIRGAIIHFIAHTPTVPKGIIGKEDMIAWLEKQGEFKSNKWTEGDIVRHGGVLALVINGRKAMKSNCEQITIQYPDEWVKTGTKERKYFFEELEKQGEQKPQGKSALEAINEEKFDNADKVKPKFHEGEWVVNNDSGCVYQIKSIRDDEYCLCPLDSEVHGYLRITDIDNECYLWTIADARDGDVLEVGYHGRLVVGIVSHINKSTGKVDVCCLLEANNFKVGIYYAQDKINPHPASKERRDILFQKMKEAGYEWDAEKKKLKKLSQQEVAKNKSDQEEGEQKSAWSEEDALRLEEVIYMIKANGRWIRSDDAVKLVLDWLKCLKDRVQPQPKKEWSEGDKEEFQIAIDTLVEAGQHDSAHWLKSLKQRIGG